MTGIYVIGTRGRFCKIGKALNVESRLQAHRTSCPFELYVVALIATTPRDLSIQEKQYHRAFSDRRIRGEWFSLSEDDVAYLRNDEINSIVYGWGIPGCLDPPNLATYNPDQVPLEWRGPFVDVPLSCSLSAERRILKNIGPG